jgi:hypothetical protein
MTPLQTFVVTRRFHYNDSRDLKPEMKISRQVESELTCGLAVAQGHEGLRQPRTSLSLPKHKSETQLLQRVKRLNVQEKVNAYFYSCLRIWTALFFRIRKYKLQPELGTYSNYLFPYKN